MTESITVSPQKGALLRVAFWKSREEGFYQFEVDQTQYILLFSKNRANSKYYDLVIKKNNESTNEKLKLTRSEVIRSYFKDEMRNLNPDRTLTFVNTEST
jgi:hypothetical protein